MAKTKTKPTPPTLPMQLARLDRLQGGTYGNVLLRALTKAKAELWIGGDFVNLTPADARTLHTALGHFLALGAPRTSPATGAEEVEAVVVEAEAMDVAAVPRRRRSRTRRPAQVDAS